MSDQGSSDQEHDSSGDLCKRIRASHGAFESRENPRSAGRCVEALREGRRPCRSREDWLTSAERVSLVYSVSGEACSTHGCSEESSVGVRAGCSGHALPRRIERVEDCEGRRERREAGTDDREETWNENSQLLNEQREERSDEPVPNRYFPPVKGMVNRDI